MKIFVAGANGAIGRPLLAELLARKQDVVALTRSVETVQSLAAQEVEPAIRQGLRFVDVDVFNVDSVKVAITTLNRK